MKRRVLGISFAICNLIFDIAVGGSIGTTTADVLKVNLSPRPAAMGGAFTAEANDLNAFYFNPAGLQSLAFRHVALNHYTSVSEIRYETLSYGQSLGATRSLGGFATFRHMPTIDNENGFPPVKASDLVIGVGYGQLLGKYSLTGRKLRVGGNVKFIQSTLGGVTARSFAIDLGFQALHIFKKLDLGLAVQNLGTPMKFIEESDPLPLFIRLGLGYPIRVGVVDNILAVDFTKPMDSLIKIDFGDETWLFEHKIAVRLGYSVEAAVSVDFDANGLPVADTAKFKLNPGVGNLFASFAMGFGFEYEKRSITYLVDMSYNPARYASTTEGTFLIGFTMKFKRFSSL